MHDVPYRLGRGSPSGYFLSLVLAALPLAYVQALSIGLLALLVLPTVAVGPLAIITVLALHRLRIPRIWAGQFR